ncbi:MAG: hypothetical protein AB8F65_06170 [Woeseiaceae bacterium]
MSELPPNPPARLGARFDHIASAFAVALSLAALFVSFAEVSSERAQQKASVWPHIELGESYSDEGFKIRLTNKGVGPALMGQVVLSKDGKAIENLDALILATLGPDEAFSYERYSTSNPSNSVVAAGESYVLFAVAWDETTQRLISAWSGGAVDITTCYCSVHEDCWETSLTQDVTRRTESCNTGVAL